MQKKGHWVRRGRRSGRRPRGAQPPHRFRAAGRARQRWLSFAQAGRLTSERASLIAVVAFKPIRLGQENSCGLHYKNKNKTRRKKRGKKKGQEKGGEEARGRGAAACPQAPPGQTHQAEQTDGGAGGSLGRGFVCPPPPRSGPGPGPRPYAPGRAGPAAPWEAPPPRSEPASAEAARRGEGAPRHREYQAGSAGQRERREGGGKKQRKRLIAIASSPSSPELCGCGGDPAWSCAGIARRPGEEQGSIINH